MLGCPNTGLSETTSTNNQGRRSPNITSDTDSESTYSDVSEDSSSNGEGHEADMETTGNLDWSDLGT